MTTDLVPVDKTAASVVGVLENAKTWLATAVEMTGPEEIAAAKAHIRTAETYARELHLSKDIQQDAQEMVRRAEYALGKSIRKGQAEGTIRKTGDRTVRYDQAGLARGEIDRARLIPNSSVADTSAADLIPGGQDRHDVYAMVDGVSPDEFEDALEGARAEGNLTRANVVRKVKQQAGPTTRDQRADLIDDLAQQGYSSRQMPAKVGVSEERVREIARAYDITIPADRSVVRTRRIDSTNVVVNTATALEGLVSGVELIDYAAVDPAVASQWVDSLSESMRALNRFVRQIKEQTHD